MKRIDDNPQAPIKFSAFGGPMYINAETINHGLTLPIGKVILETGIFILGFLETDKGKKIEAALRTPDTFAFHLCARDASIVSYYHPIRLFPNSETNGEIEVPADLFNPYYNCHGHSFADRLYWINPLASKMENGRMVLTKPNVDLILEDEFLEVRANTDWDVAVLRNSKNEILHSVRKENDKINSKYDGYQMVVHDRIEDVDIARYGNGVFKYYKKNGR